MGKRRSRRPSIRKRGVLVTPLARRPILGPMDRAVHFYILAMSAGLAHRVRICSLSRPGASRSAAPCTIIAAGMSWLTCVIGEASARNSEFEFEIQIPGFEILDSVFRAGRKTRRSRPQPSRPPVVRSSIAARCAPASSPKARCCKVYPEPLRVAANEFGRGAQVVERVFVVLNSA